MRKIIFMLALLTLLGIGTWGAVSTATVDDSPEPLPTAPTPALLQSDELSLERADHREKVIQRVLDQERKRQVTEAEAKRKREAAEREAETQRQREAEQDVAPPPEDPWCYPGGPGCPGRPDTSGVAPAPNNGGQPPGSYCYISPEGRVCTTY